MGSENIIEFEAVSAPEASLDISIDEQSGIEAVVEADPVADFLAKHGSKLTRNHKGEPVTYYQAVEECPALPMMIKTLGEGALSLTAAELSEGQTEEEENPEGDEENSGVDTKEQIVESDEEVASVQSPSARLEKSHNQRSQPGKETAPSKTITYSTPKTAETANRQPHNRPVEAVESRPERSPNRQATAAQTAVAAARPVSQLNETVVTQKPAPEARPAPAAAVAEESVNDGKIGETTNEPRQFIAESAAAQLFIEPVTAIEAVSATDEDGTDLSEELGDEPAPADIPELSEIVAVEDRDPDEDRQAIPEPEDTPDDESQFHVTNDGPFQGLAEADGETTPLRALTSEAIDAVIELPLPVEQVESTLVELAEVIQGLEPDEAEAVNEILDDIVLKIEAVKRWTIDDSSGALTVSETQPEAGEAIAERYSREGFEAEIQELFIKLFDYLEIEYAPGLAETFARLAIGQDLVGLIKPSAAEEPAIIGDGTHEIIKQLLSAVADLKNVLARAYRLGEAAVRSYTGQMALVRA